VVAAAEDTIYTWNKRFPLPVSLSPSDREERDEEKEEMRGYVLHGTLLRGRAWCGEGRRELKEIDR
jgi:hypothetical protein